MKVLFDNLLIRGFYSYLKGNTSRFAGDCFWHFIESIVIYDEIIITDVDNEITDILTKTLSHIIKLSDHEKELGLKDNWWMFKSEDEVPILFRNLLSGNMQIIKRIANKIKYPASEILEIEKLGFPDKPPFRIEEIKDILLRGKNEWTYSKDFETFIAYHLWFTYYCMQVSHKRKIPYIPNPSRYSIITMTKNIDFYYPEIRRKIIEDFREIRKKLLLELAESGYLSVAKDKLEMPLIANYILRKTKDPYDALKYSIDLRYSAGAIAFREYCMSFEKSDNLGHILEMKREIDNFKELLINDINLLNIKRSIIVNKYGIKSIEVPKSIEGYDIEIKLMDDLFDKIGIKNRYDHFVFLHELVKTI